jgi:NhaP-type Na+/H+ or K+/H+ antiporter
MAVAGPLPGTNAEADPPPTFSGSVPSAAATGVAVVGCCIKGLRAWTTAELRWAAAERVVAARCTSFVGVLGCCCCCGGGFVSSVVGVVVAVAALVVELLVVLAFWRRARRGGDDGDEAATAEGARATRSSNKRTS